MNNQLIFIIIIVIILIFTNKHCKKENFQSKSENTIANMKYPSNIIDCNIYSNKRDCEKGFQCNWIDEKLKAYQLNTPFCSGNILAVST